MGRDAIYLSDGRVEIDNNLVENGIRPTALGKKNDLFFGEVEAGETSAILYTVIENARRSGLDPQAYLRDIFTRLPKMKQNQTPSPRRLGQSSKSRRRKCQRKALRVTLTRRRPGPSAPLRSRTGPA